MTDRELAKFVERAIDERTGTERDILSEIASMLCGERPRSPAVPISKMSE